jgi:hypothetical protein
MESDSSGQSNIGGSAPGCGDPWGGSFVLPFQFNLTPGNGVLVSMRAVAQPAFLTGGAVGADFLDTATLEFLPPPGMIVTLASGQTFGAAAAADAPVPEPTSLVLCGAGLVGVVRRGLRK